MKTMKALPLLALISATCAASDELGFKLYTGLGYAYKADQPALTTITTSLVIGDYTINYADWYPYLRSPNRARMYPDFFDVRDSFVPKHKVLDLTYEFFKAEDILGTGIDFTYNLGIAYSTVISRATSSHFVFKQDVCLTWSWVKGCTSHGSNAGLLGSNAGEDQVTLQILLASW